MTSLLNNYAINQNQKSETKSMNKHRLATGLRKTIATVYKNTPAQLQTHKHCHNTTKHKHMSLEPNTKWLFSPSLYKYIKTNGLNLFFFLAKFYLSEKLMLKSSSPSIGPAGWPSHPQSLPQMQRFPAFTHSRRRLVLYHILKDYCVICCISAAWVIWITREKKARKRN